MSQVMNSSVDRNVGFWNAYRGSSETSKNLQDTLDRLSTGLQINSAKDDSMGLGIAERITTQIHGTNQAIRSSHISDSIHRTSDNAVLDMDSPAVLQQVRERSVQSTVLEDYNSDADRLTIQSDLLMLEHVAQQVEQGLSLNRGITGFQQIVQNGLTSGDLSFDDRQGSQPNEETILLSTTNNTPELLHAGITEQLTNHIDSALNQILDLRNEFAAKQSSFDNAMIALINQSEDMSASSSRIQDTNFAVETAELTRVQILQQAGISSLAQVNQAPNLDLFLLQ